MESDIESLDVRFKYPSNASIGSELPSWIRVKGVYSDHIELQIMPNCVSEEYRATIDFLPAGDNSTLTIIQKASPNPLFKSGRGTEAEPFGISTPQHLDNIRKRAIQSHYFLLLNDIDMSSYLSGSTQGWIGIDNFNGNFNGDMHYIKGIWANSTDSEVSLFRNMNGAIITGIRLQLDPRGFTGPYTVAGIDAGGKGQISSCSVEGNMKSLKGAVYGIAYASQTGYVTINQCWTSGNFSALNTVYGIGWDGIRNCYSTANISGGGYCAYGLGYIAEYSYFAGRIDPSFNETYISYYNTGSNYCLTGCGAFSGALSASETQLKMRATFAGWDFNNVWQIQEGVAYPTLRVFN